LKLVVEPMDLDDIAQVLEVDRESYTIPWPASAYRREILHNRSARYYVLREVPEGQQPEPEPEPQRPKLPFLRWHLRTGDASDGRRGALVGYAGMWMMIDEAHITTIAVRTQWRGRGFGELLLASLLETAVDMGARRLTLEVRVSNDAAQKLYQKYGFHEQGTRLRYYSDNNEDAYIMTTDDVQQQNYRDLFDSLVQTLEGRLLSRQNVLIGGAPFDRHQPSRGEREGR
jgi:[ribosomal protein S18]-alanine N-acetyltransferase